MLQDPVTLVVGSSTVRLPRVETAGTRSIYRNADQSYTLTVSHQRTSKKRIRHLVRLDRRGIVTNPLDSTNDYDSYSISIVFDRPEYGFTNDDIQDSILGVSEKLLGEDGILEPILGLQH